jgi:hypothetical protein
MKNEMLASLGRLSDFDLVLSLRTLVAREREATAEVIAHLAELDTRDVHLREGFGSLYLYCRDALGLSEWESYNRIEVARTAHRFPVILDLLADGSVHLTAVRLLAPHLRTDNHCDLLASACGKTKAQIQEIVAGLAPKPDAPTCIRRTTSTSPPIVPRPGLKAMGALDVPVPDAPAPAVPSPQAPALPTAARATVAPLSPDRYRLQVTIGGDTLEKLRCAQDMLGHAIPSGDEAAVLDRALTSLLVELAREKFAYTPRPAPARGTKRGNISAAVQRAVWVRDLGRCAFIGSGGHRCNERRFVEFHHLDPKALGGEATVETIELRCRRHNDYEGRLWFGKRRRSPELVPEQVRLSVTDSCS